MDRNLAQMLLYIFIVLLIHFLFSVLGLWTKSYPKYVGGRYFPIFLLRVGLFTLMYIDSLMVLAKLFSSLAIILKFPIDVSWPLLLWCINIGDGALRCSFTKSSSWLSYVFFIAVNLPTTVAVNHTVLVGHSILILWWHQDVFQCLTSLEVYSYSMFSTNVLDALTYALCVWYCNVAFLAECFDVGVCFFSLLCCFLKVFLIAHLGYLHWPSTSSRCCNFSSISLGVEQMVCALCVRVLITLYIFPDRPEKAVMFGSESLSVI